MTDDRPVLWTIGDSWTDPNWRSGGMWPGVVGERLGLQVHNTGVAGSGYVNGHLFAEQATERPGGGADVVVVFGSVNDRHHPVHSVRVHARALHRLVQAACPDGTLIVVGPQWFDPGRPAPEQVLAHRDTLHQLTMEVGGMFADASRWMECRWDLMHTDNHPTAGGQQHLADMIGPLVARALAERALRRRMAAEAEAAAADPARRAGGLVFPLTLGGTGSVDEPG